ncbi:MAG: hypothetical protein ACK4FF_02550 [Limnobacter sp.]|uniref:sensor histidine kinase n=1 Tax=Limnobacter sp. TaxID=2003368 RepID=UPI00391D54CB
MRLQSSAFWIDMIRADLSRMPRFQILYGLMLALALGITGWAAFFAPFPARGDDDTAQLATLLDRAEVTFSTPPNISANDLLAAGTGTRVTLPNQWDDINPGFEGQAWYVIHFDLDPDKPTPDSVYLPKVVMNAQVYLNGIKIGGLGAMEGELTRMWNHPMIMPFPSELLKATENVMLVQVAGYRDYNSGLGRVWVGPRDELQTLYQMSYRWQITGSMMATLIALLCGLVLVIFSKAGHANNGLVFLGLAVLDFSVRNFGFFNDWVPLGHDNWATVVRVSHAWFACLFGQFLIRYMGKRWAPLRLGLWCYAACVTVLTVVLNEQDALAYTLILISPVMPFLLVLNIMLLHQAWQQHSVESTILGSSTLLFLLLSFRDLMVGAGWLPSETVLMSQYSGIMMFFSGCWVLLRRFRLMYAEQQTMNQRLNAQLMKREAQLLEQFNTIRAIEQQRTKDEERRRIMQDIHDGVGSSLVSALSETESRSLSQEETRTVLQDCLDDLRMAIDSLDPQSDDLLALLGNFRWRYERRLKLSGLSLSWQVTDAPTLVDYSSRDMFELLRIVQEAFGNILKHAKASRIVLSVVWDNTQDLLTLSILDDGQGNHTDPQQPSRGRGLAHMALRAKAIGLGLSLGPGLNGQGFGVVLTIPRQRVR